MMNKKWNNRGQIVLLALVIFMVIGLILGVAFFGKLNGAIQDAIKQLGTARSIILLVIVLAVIFHKFTEAFLMTLLGWIK